MLLKILKSITNICLLACIHFDDGKMKMDDMNVIEIKKERARHDMHRIDE